MTEGMNSQDDIHGCIDGVLAPRSQKVVINTSKVIRKAADDIYQILKTNPYPVENKYAVKQIEIIANQLSSISIYAAEKAYNIADLSGVFYSSNKHEEHPGGADQIYLKMRNDLINTIHNNARRYENSYNDSSDTQY